MSLGRFLGDLLVPRIFHNQPLKGIKVNQQACPFCNSENQQKVASTLFWDLQESDFIQCLACGHIRLAPPLTDKNTALGCQAYWLRETSLESARNQARNRMRAFRRGVAFAGDPSIRQLQPFNILELGPGNGFFSRGVQYVFPESIISVVDIVPEVLEENKKVHGFTTHLLHPENMQTLIENTFDLIIARDFIEHVNRPDKVIRECCRILKPGGLFHFLTPNGYEDFWAHYLCEQFYHKPSQLLLNHVQYFNGQGLSDFLARTGFTPVEYYAFDLKGRKRGRGRKFSPDKAAAAAESASVGINKSNVRETTFGSTYSASETIDNLKKQMNQSGPINSEAILNVWWIKHAPKSLVRLYCRMKHGSFLKVEPAFNIGHEISGVFRKIL